MSYDKKNPKVGEVNDATIRRDEDGDHYVDLLGDDEERFYITMHNLYTLENCIAQLRAACQDPKDRVIAAARAVQQADPGDEDWGALVDALGALDNATPQK